LDCKPFDAEDIQKAILLRHKSSGLKFEIQSLSEDRFSNLKMARLFNAYFDISDGNIGCALHYWISNISGIRQDVLTMRRPEKISTEALNNLSVDWTIWLQQLILHKQLSLQRLEHISQLSDKAVHDIMHALKRSGIVVKEPTGFYSINPYIHSVLVKRLREIGML
jgi:hypothetical protein